jgi:vancomycin resistance protein YoaR
MGPPPGFPTPAGRPADGPPPSGPLPPFSDEWSNPTEWSSGGRSPTDPDSVDRRKVLLAVGGVAGLLVAIYLAGLLFLGGKVPSGTQVANVDIGGLSTEEAQQRLESELSDSAQEPIRLTWKHQTFEIDPKQAGISLDIEATVDKAGGGGAWNPAHMVDVLFGGDEVDPVLEVDQKALDAELAGVAEELNVEPVEPMVTFNRRGGRDVTQPDPGRAMDRDAAVNSILGAYLRTDEPVQLSVDEVAPTVDAGELSDALEQIADPAMSGPVPLQLPSRTVPLTVREFAPALSLEVTDGELAPKFDIDRLSQAIDGLTKRIGSEAKNAEVVLRNDRPVVIPAQPGVTLDPKEVADVVTPVLGKTGDERTVEIETSVGKPDFTTKEARDLGIHRVVSSFTTYFPHADYRNVNLGRAADLINGTVLKPGDTFSLNDTVGERTEENGFTVGYIISNGVYAEDLGGGVSQVATTTFNAAFFAGLKDVEHKTHSFYIDRYPVGREATVAWPSVDLRFKNTTPYGVLIEEWIEPSTPSSYGEMHVRIWSTKYWDITAGASKRYDYTSAGTRYDASKDCYATTGYSGFDIDVYRYFRRHDSNELVRKETMHTTYIPLDTVICRAPPDDKGPGGGNRSDRGGR